MFTSIILGVKQEQYRRYSEAFNFFQSKSINMVIANRKLDYVVHYRDLEFLDDETEYFKRYYATSETSTRIKKLINYYELNMTPPAPNLLPIHNYHILETRNRKLLKLVLMKDKSKNEQQEEQGEQAEDSEANMILSQLNHSNYSAPSSAKEEDSEQQSFDSQPHNAYESDARDARNNSFGEEINFGEHPDFLVLQFKQPDDPPKINIIPPLPPPPPEKVTVSVAVQTLPEQKKVEEKKEMEAKAREKQKERERQREKERERERQRQREREREKEQRQKWQREERQHQQREKARAKAAQAKKEQSNNEGLAIRSQIKQNAILTQSMDLVGSPKEQKKKASTFMDYYNSIPVKSPTNLLQKYLKRKK